MRLGSAQTQVGPLDAEDLNVLEGKIARAPEIGGVLFSLSNFTPLQFA